MKKSFSNSFPNKFKVKDYSVSGEFFTLVYDAELNMYSTSPQPSPDYISKYYKSQDYISHTDSKRGVFEKIYHSVRSINLKRKFKVINQYAPNGMNLLDFGCGTGDFIKFVLDKGWSVKGIEPDMGARELAKTKTNATIGDVEDFWGLNEKFNVITLWHVLEHLPDLKKHIQSFNHLLADEGRLIIAVPNFQSYDAQYYRNFWAAFDVPRHFWHFSQKSIKLIFEKENLKIEKISPMKFDSYYVSLLSEKYKKGWINPLNALYRGWLSNLKANSSGEYSSLIYVLKKG